MALVREAIGTVATGATGNTVSVEYPTPGGGIEAGWLLVLKVVNSSTFNMAAPVGWTIGVSFQAGTSSPIGRIWYKLADGGETGSVSVSVSNNTGRQGVMEVWSGVDQTTPIDVAGTNGNFQTGTTAYDCPSLTTTMAGVGLSYAACHNSTTGTYTPPTNPAAFTEDVDSTANIPGFTAGHLIWAGSGATGVIDLTRSGSVRGGVGVIAIRPAAAGATDLTVAAAAQAQTAENVTLTQVHELTSAAATQAQTADSPTLTQVHNLTVQDATHGHTADSPALTQAHGLSVAAATHEHTAENATLVAAGDLSVDDATHAHAADGPALTQAHALTVADAAQAQTADAATLTQAHSLTVADTDHAQSAEAATLTQTHVLTVEAATHEQTAGSPTLGVVSEGDGEPVERPRFSITDTTPELTINDTTARVTLDDTTGTLALTDTTARLTLDEATALVGV